MTYVRPRGKPESVPVPNSAEMRALLDLATAKGVREFIRVARDAGLPLGQMKSEAEVSTEAYEDEKREIWSYIAERPEDGSVGKALTKLSDYGRTDVGSPTGRVRCRPSSARRAGPVRHRQRRPTSRVAGSIRRPPTDGPSGSNVGRPRPRSDRGSPPRGLAYVRKRAVPSPARAGYGSTAKRGTCVRPLPAQLVLSQSGTSCSTWSRSRSSVRACRPPWTFRASRLMCRYRASPAES